MDQDKLAELLRRAGRPVLILSSRAGLGNFKAGEGLRLRFRDEPSVHHRAVEELIGPELQRREFGRHRLICERYSWLIGLLYAFPFHYALKRARGALDAGGDLAPLEEFIRTRGIATVIAVNHRSAFWTGVLKRRGRIRCALWGLLTDYGFSPGWRFIFWDQVEKLLGPAEIGGVPAGLRDRYAECPLPVDPELLHLKGTSSDKDHVLVAGGGWGLGPVAAAVRTLHELDGDIHIHAACGANTRLKQLLAESYAHDARVEVCGELPSLTPLYTRCGAIVSKPGGMTIAEAHAAGRMLFLLPGLPVVESANGRFAERRFGARRFSAEAFAAWRNAQPQ